MFTSFPKSESKFPMEWINQCKVFLCRQKRGRKRVNRKPIGITKFLRYFRGWEPLWTNMTCRVCHWHHWIKPPLDGYFIPSFISWLRGDRATFCHSSGLFRVHVQPGEFLRFRRSSRKLASPDILQGRWKHVAHPLFRSIVHPVTSC